jgi:pilus assembly protein CpaE
MARADIAALSGSWKALLISPNRTIVGELNPLLSQHLPNTPVFEMQSYPNRQAVAEFSGAKGPNLCFLDLISDVERALPLIGDLLAVQPNLKIVVLLASKNPDIILRAIRQGAVEFLVRPFDVEQFDAAFNRIATLEQGAQGEPQGKVISLFPAKGACGASTLASSLAQYYKRTGVKKTLLADLDPLTGTLSFLHKLKANYSFLDVLSRMATMDADVWKGIVAQQNGIDILLSPDIVNNSVAELHDASALLTFARTFYEVSVIDAGSVFGDWNVTIARNSDQVLVVTTNELPALQAAQRAMAYLDSQRISSNRIRLIVNRYNKEYGLSREVIETALHCEVYHLVPSDYEALQAALLEGRAVPPSAPLGKAVAQLGDMLVPRTAKAETPKTRSSPLSGLLSLFSKTR